MDMDSSDSDQENNNKISAWKSSQQRKLCYRELLNRVEDIQEKDETGLETAQEIGNIIKQVNTIEMEKDVNQRCQYPDETLLDSMVLSSASNVLVKCIDVVNVNTLNYVPWELASKIKSFCKENEEFENENLLKLLSTAQEIISEVPEYSFTYGAYDLHNLPQPKQKKLRQKPQKDKFEKKKPEKVTNLEKEEKGIDEIIKVMYDVLTECYNRNDQQPIRYYDYVIDTSSFTNTVENMFYCSFLVRDGQAHIDLDNKGEPRIKPIKKRKLTEFREAGGVNSQIISVITIPEWETFDKEGYLQKYQNKQ